MVATAVLASGFDGTIHDWVLDHRTATLDSVFRGVTDLGGAAVLVPLTIIVVVLLFVARRRWLALFVAAAGLGGLVIQNVLKDLVQRPRPPHSDWLVHAGGWSFPSGHSVQSAAAYLSFAVAISVLVSSHRWRVVAWALAVLLPLAVGFSRVYLGVHWPTDVLAGWVIGTAWVALLYVLLRDRFERSPTRVEG